MEGSALQVSTNDILQYRTLSTRLRTYDGDLRQIYGVLDLAQASVHFRTRTQAAWLSGAKGWCITYSYSCKDILEFVHEGNKARVVHVDPWDSLAGCGARGYLGTWPYAFGLVAMTGAGEVEGRSRSRCALVRDYAAIGVL
jgi:hypothetical protein